MKKYIDAGKHSEIDVGVDGGKWYAQKVHELRKQSDTSVTSHGKTNPPILPITGWQDFKAVPFPTNFNYGHIHHHIVESVEFLKQDKDYNTDSDSDNEHLDLHTAKPIVKGKLFYSSGHVKMMKAYSDGQFYFLKAKVMASYQIKVSYDVSTILSSESGFVKDASCTCKASAMGRCNHIAGLLFALLDFTNKSENDTSCTSQTCQWNKGRSTKRNPQKIFEATYSSSKKKAKLLNPCPPQFAVSPSEADCAHFLQDLQTSSAGKVPSMWETLLHFKYEDYILDDLQVEILKEKRKTLLLNLSRGENSDTPKAIQIVKEQQSDEWFTQRRLRITASQCKKVFSLQSPSSISNYLRSSLWDSQKLYTKGMLYGQENEAIALAEYRRGAQLNSPNLKAIKTGFWINSKFPELGCSPDGLVLDPQSDVDIYGLVEIKCPYILQAHSVKKFDDCLNSAQVKRFCLERVNQELHLKHNHEYYYQVQMQLGVTGLKWCDFVVWSPKDIFVERISFDSEFWGQVKCKLVEFHHSRICPEYFEMRLPRELPPMLL